MKLISLTQPEVLNDFAQAQAVGHFLQTWDWAVFQTEAGQRVVQLGLMDQDNLVASAVIIKKKIFGFPYWYLPRGPLISPTLEPAQSTVVWQTWLEQLTFLAKQEGAKFLRLEPAKLTAEQKQILKITQPIQPQQTMVLDLSVSSDDLLAQMHQKTRYNIRLAEKKGVVIEELPASHWPEVWPIMQATKERDNFGLHSRAYYQTLVNQPSAKLLVAKYEQQIVAGGIFWQSGQTFTYLHGASSNLHRNVMAPYLLQWQAIKLAQKQGCQHYDFYGIDSRKWPGVTRFKQGFGGQIINYPGTFDLICSPLYYGVYRLGRKIRRWF